MLRTFCFQHASIALRHHSAERLLARIDLPPTSTNTGLVWLDGKTRRQTQLLALIGTENDTACGVPSAMISFFAPATPLPTTSTGTFRPSPWRARSRSQ